MFLPTIFLPHFFKSAAAGNSTGVIINKIILVKMISLQTRSCSESLLNGIFLTWLSQHTKNKCSCQFCFNDSPQYSSCY